VEANSGGNLTTYGYDVKSRLLQDQTTGPNAHLVTYGYCSRDSRIFSNETGVIVSYNFDLGERLTTSSDGAAYSFDANGNLTLVSGVGLPVTMAYDTENRLRVHRQGATVTTYAYDGDGLKRSEATGSSVTTLVWDGSDYLQGRS